MSLIILMYIIKTTLSFTIRWCHGPIFIPINILRFALHYLLSYILCMIILLWICTH